MRFAALTTSYAALRSAPASRRTPDQAIIAHLLAATTRAMAQDPRPRPQSRNSFLPKNLPQERWGLLMPAAVALALLLIVAMVVVRMSS